MRVLLALMLTALMSPSMVDAGMVNRTGGKHKDVDLSKVILKAHLTTGDVLKGVEYIGRGFSRFTRGGNFTFRSNFNSVIQIELEFLKYIDFDLQNEGAAAGLYDRAAKDEIHLKNGDLIKGDVGGFRGNEVEINTEYGTQRIDVEGIKYIIFKASDVKSEEEAEEGSESDE